MPHDAWPSSAALLLASARLPFTTSIVSSTLYYWWLDSQGEQDTNLSVLLSIRLATQRINRPRHFASASIGRLNRGMCQLAPRSGFTNCADAVTTQPPAGITRTPT